MCKWFFDFLNLCAKSNSNIAQRIIRDANSLITMKCRKFKMSSNAELHFQLKGKDYLDMIPRDTINFQLASAGCRAATTDSKVESASLSNARAPWSFVSASSLASSMAFNNAVTSLEHLEVLEWLWTMSIDCSNTVTPQHFWWWQNNAVIVWTMVH